ncbi:MAG TPA: hypothetical protein VK832_11785 [Burkholderiaceae bacterium]|jgi:hypothetical protein|nr:hypothetical protein [Burkholderiaceae bacterium]
MDEAAALQSRQRIKAAGLFSLPMYPIAPAKMLAQSVAKVEE